LGLETAPSTKRLKYYEAKKTVCQSLVSDNWEPGLLLPLKTIDAPERTRKRFLFFVVISRVCDVTKVLFQIQLVQHPVRRVSKHHPGSVFSHDSAVCEHYQESLDCRQRPSAVLTVEKAFCFCVEVFSSVHALHRSECSSPLGCTLFFPWSDCYLQFVR
jgi:hypothetical protein